MNEYWGLLTVGHAHMSTAFRDIASYELGLESFVASLDIKRKTLPPDSSSSIRETEYNIYLMESNLNDYEDTSDDDE